MILDLCGGSGAWSAPYKKAGYDVQIIDLETDVRLFKYPGPVMGILAAPPCTVFANAGNRWKRTPEDLRQALSIVDACLRIVIACRPQFWALENPVGKLQRYLGPPRFAFNPCDFGDPYTKRTYLWGEFNIPRFPPVPPIDGSKMHTKIRSQEKRSITPAKFARAFFKVNQ